MSVSVGQLVSSSYCGPTASLDLSFATVVGGVLYLLKDNPN